MINNNEIIYSDRNTLEKKGKTSIPSKRKLLIILIPIIAVLLIGISVLVYFLLRPPSDPPQEVNDDESKSDIIIPGSPKLENRKLEKEFEILTIPGELKRVFVSQRSIEETKVKGVSILVDVLRKTNYNIYIMDEEEADEENKLFYSKLYTAAIAIVSECNTINFDDCEPQKMVDLTEKKKNNINGNARILNNEQDYKDLPVPLCLFKITDNNFITSISCPESFSESKKNEILLDLYFFRPPAIERADKKNDNITITIKEDRNKNRKYIRETNGGTCNIYDNIGSLCTTDMNTTTDLEGNLLQYDELAITNITSDENNGYIKNKLTHLIDISEEIKDFNPNNYKTSLEKLLANLQPYMKEDIQFTTDDFKELYHLVKTKTKFFKKKNSKKFRNLVEYATYKSQGRQERNLFNYKDSGGINIDYNLINEPGINGGEALKLYSNIMFDDDNRELVYKDKLTNISFIIDKLSVLSKAGNHLATELYNGLKDKLNTINNDISLKFSELKALIQYYDISEIFDSTLALDSIRNFNKTIISISENLKNKLNGLFNNVKIGDIRDYTYKLNLLVHNYILNSHSLIKQIFDNLKELGNALNSCDNRLTEITTYYLNYTSFSYVDIIQQVQNILENYYINEKNKVLNKSKEILDVFEEIANKTLKDEINKIDNLTENLVNKVYTINSASDEEYENLKTNLINSKKYIYDIIKKVKDFIIEEIGLKNNGYFISDSDLKANNNSYNPVIVDSKDISKKLDNDEFIDKKFDEIMINFRQNYTNIIDYLEKEKIQQFVLDEDTLKDSLFTTTDRSNITNEMENLRSKVINKIIEENNYYLDNIGTNITNFNNGSLNQVTEIISNLDIIYFSEDSLKNLANLFESAFSSCLSKIHNEIKVNEELAKNYFDYLQNVIKDDKYLYQLLTSYKINEIPSRYRRKSFYYYVDNIYSKQKTRAYLSKYSDYIANFEYSKSYIENQLYLDLANEYKNILSKIREKLQSIINIKITEKFPDFKELNFYDKHLKLVNEFFNRLNKYFSENIFNTKYLNLLNTEKKTYNQNIDSIKQYINSKHNSINSLSLNDDISNDFCFLYQRKLCYGCTNCAWNYYVYDSYCLPLKPYQNNHLNLIRTEIKSDSKLKEFKKTFEDFYSNFDKSINSYCSILKNLEEKLNFVKEDTLNRKITQDYLVPFNNWVDSILTKKFGNEIIRTTYNYYQKIIEERLGKIINDVSDKWDDIFDGLLTEVEENYDEFKTSTYEFGLMAQTYETLINQNLTIKYFESIESFQKNELNYTISYYYNYYIKVIKQAYQFVLNNIPINSNGFYDILNERKKEINDGFNSLIKKVKDSYNNDISYKKQKYVIQYSDSDFFDIGSILSDNLISSHESLKNKNDRLYEFIGYNDDQYSVISRYYLENSESGKQMAKFYKPINDKKFIDLGLYRFKDILLDNWIFDKYEFKNKLNESLINLAKDLDKDYEFKKKEYSEILENEIVKILKNESIENKISNFFLSEIKDLDSNNINKINENINGILNKINEYIIYETNILKTSLTTYNNDYSKILSTLNEYKNKIFNKINSTIFIVINEFYSNINEKVYKEYIENGLNEYIEETKKVTSTNENCKEYPLLISSYKVGEQINRILDEIVQRYKDKTRKTIDFKYQQYYQKIKKSINLDGIKNLINKTLDNYYSSTLEPALKKFAIYNSGDEKYTQFDFSNEEKNGINKVIEEKIENIKNIILSTKGNNFEVDIYFYSWEPMKFSKVSYDVIRPMCRTLYNFYASEAAEQNSEVDSLLKERITSNFEDLLNNVIPTFGNEYFERIIKYNENFKISALYDNIRYSLTETLLYYISLKLCTEVTSLPKDLKIRLFNLNDLDSTLANINNKIIEIFEKNVAEFIKESRISIIDKYLSYLKNDDEISQSFNINVLKKINDSLTVSMPEMGKIYEKKLEKYLTEKLESSFKKLMNDKTKDMIRFVNEKKMTLKSKLEGLFSLDSDQVLIDINQKINTTLESINNYTEYFNSFEIPNNIKEFLNNYSASYIKPEFKDFITELNKATKDIILSNLEKNSENVESLNTNEFNNKIDNTISYFNNNYSKNFSDNINSYGMNKTDYSERLQKQMENKNMSLLRRLDGSQTEEDMLAESQEKIADEGIEENFQKIINTLNVIKINFDSLEIFKEFDNKINNNKQNINEKSKYAKKIIEENDYEEEVHYYLNEKLLNLTNISLDYYNNINSSYYELRNYIKKSIEEIYNSLNLCANITYEEFNKEFDKIINNTKSFNTDISENSKSKTLKRYEQKSDHKTNYVDSVITDLKAQGEFKFNIMYKNESIKKLIISANIINRSRPNKININITNSFSFCGKVINTLEIEFNEANFTTDLLYDSITNNINLTMHTLFDKYIYYSTYYLINGTSTTQNADSGENNMDIPIFCKNKITEILIPRNGTNVDERNETSYDFVKA